MKIKIIKINKKTILISSFIVLMVVLVGLLVRLLKENTKNEVLSTAKSVVLVDSTEYVQNNLSNLEENTRNKYVDGKISLPAKSVVITADAGIKVAVTTKSGRVYKGADKLELPRMRIMDGMSLNALKNIVK